MAKSIRKILQEAAIKYPTVSVEAPQHILDEINSRRNDSYQLKEFRVIVQEGMENSLSDDFFREAYVHIEAVDENEWEITK